MKRHPTRPYSQACYDCGRGSYHCTCEEVPPAPKEIGIKHDGEKPQLSKYLHPLFANRHFLPIVLETIEVLKYGAAKYQPDNWTKVTPRERYLDAALRHLSAADSGIERDEESGLLHVAHATCSILMYGALTLAERAKRG